MLVYRTRVPLRVAALDFISLLLAALDIQTRMGVCHSPRDRAQAHPPREEVEALAHFQPSAW